MLAVVLLCAVVTEGAIATGDDHASWDDPAWAGWSVVPDTSRSTFFYVDAQDKVHKFEPKTFKATQSYVATHVRTDEVHDIEHYHFQYDYDNTDGRPSKTQANDFWDRRVAADALGYVTRYSDATVRSNCHAWAFEWKADPHGAATPSYNHWFDDPTTAYADDCGDARGVKSGDVAQYDFLRYGTTTHTAVVLNVYDPDPPGGGNAPLSYRSKCQGGGVYNYVMPTGHDWDFPYCKGTTIVVGDTLDEQPWTLDLDYHQNPNVYPDDD